ncbi:MAG: hypothetical protein JXR22_00075 [Prolixibacteraceae bacterium]|nr:hypothetical protein [Prolixibacteraceae bacterium]
METIKYFHQPTISESLGNGWYTMKKYFLWLFVAIVVSIIFDSTSRFSFSGKSTGGFDFKAFGWTFDAFPAITVMMVVVVLIGLSFFLLVRPVILYGADKMFLDAARDQEPDPKWLFRGFQTLYLNIVISHLITFAIVVAGFILLIIPGIVFLCRLAFVSYLVMDKQLDPIRAIESSWRLTRGHGWTIFGLGLMTIPIFILGILCLIVGVFPAAIWIEASFASLYQSILTHRQTIDYNVENTFN